MMGLATAFAISFFLLICLNIIYSTQEPATNIKINISHDILSISWNVSPYLENTSAVTPFSVKYCPVHRLHRTETCMINVTICEANYSAKPLPPIMRKYEDRLSDYLNNSNITDGLIDKHKPALLSILWNSTEKQFMCAVHNVKECHHNQGRKLGDLLITAAENYTELKEIYSPVSRLQKPENLSIIQKGRSVTIKWQSYYKCWIDAPNEYHIVVQALGKGSPGGKVQEVMSTFGNLLKKDWEFTPSLLDPFTMYTVKVYGYVIRDEVKGPVAEKTFRTKEAAPSEAPSIECPLCIRNILFMSYRNVTVSWKLPPKESWNGIIRLAVVKYWEENQNTTLLLDVPGRNVTLAMLPELKQNCRYIYQIKICTLDDLCSGYSEQGDIPKQTQDMKTSKIQTGHNNPRIIGLSVGLPILSLCAALVFFSWWRWKERHNRNERLSIENLQLSENDIDNRSGNGIGKDERGPTAMPNEYGFIYTDDEHPENDDALQADETNM